MKMIDHNHFICHLILGTFTEYPYLYCFSPAGKLQWKVRTGDIPAHIAFSTERFY